MAERNSRMKGRIIFLLIRKTQQFYVGSSAANIAEKAGFFKGTITRGAKIAEKSPNGIYETARYTLFTTNDFIKGKSRHGYFSYNR